MGDAVFELLVRQDLCCRGSALIKDLHRAAVARVTAPAQAVFVEAVLPALTEEELAATSTPGDFYYHMAKRFPTASLNIYSNEMNAEVFKGGREWAWNEDPDPRWMAFRTAWKD